MGTYHEIVALESVAEAAYEQRQYPDAIIAHSRALTVALDPCRPRLRAVLFNQLGQTLATNGDIQDTITAYKAGFSTLTANGNFPIEPVLVSLRAVAQRFYMFDRLPIPDQYRDTTAHALELAESDPMLPLRLLINRGDAELRQPHEQLALQTYEQALQQPQIAAAPDLYIRALEQISRIRRRRGELDAAEAALDEMLRLLNRRSDRAMRRYALSTLAGIYQDRAEVQRALTTYREVLYLDLAANDPVAAGRTRGELARLSYVAAWQSHMARA